jgi:hypothetical protein
MGPLSVASVYLDVQGKGKGHPRTDHRGPEVKQRYTSTLSLTSALERVVGPG